MDYVVVIPAAGIGKRMQTDRNKLLLAAGNKPILIHTLNVFENDQWCRGIVLVINRNDKEEIVELLKLYNITKIHSVVYGGKERQQSVYEGIKSISFGSVVVIHDGARPFVKRKHIHDLVQMADKYGAATLAVPVKDTIKKVRDGVVEETIDRSTLWSIQTPQAFQLSLIKNAHLLAEKVGFIGTDDASLVENAGEKVVIVEGDYDNIKITTPEDLFFAEAILAKDTSKS